jgi:predicted HTH transcriptional regulator
MAFNYCRRARFSLGTGRSEIRNRILAPIFKELGLIEAWGTGMRKIREAVLKYPEIDIVFQEVGYAFQVQFRKKFAIEKITGQLHINDNTGQAQ